MLKKVKVPDLKVGMFVILTGGWLKHSFSRNRFVIESKSQISRIRQSGYTEVQVDFNKSTVVTKPVTTDTPLKTQDLPDSPSLVPQDFKKILNDGSVSPQKKASYIYQTSVDIMENLLAHPTTKNISEFKDGVSDMVDCIISDDETSRNLLNLTSHDYYTYTHSVNVGVLSILLTKALFSTSSHHNLHELGAAFFLHDIGKVNIDLNLINKPEKLTPEEMQIMRGHPKHGYDILSNTNQLSEECKIIVMQHHERDDGSGYPLGLKGNEIHIYGRICSIADVFDALTSQRPYKPELKLFGALQIMKDEMHNHFSPEIFGEFINLFRSNA